ncbi:SIMPL domain-containing protein [soil metagenome]
MPNVTGSGRAIIIALTLMVSGAGQIQAQQQGMAAPHRTIRVTGVGETQVRPDQARIMFAVETTGATAQVAARDNAQLMDRVISALVAAGVPRTDIETRGYSLHPDYAHDEGRREPRIRGYRASNQVVLRTTQLDRVGGFIDTALGAGANRMDGIMFGLRDTAPAQAIALRSAVEAAHASARTIAEALGVQLGPVLDASTSTDLVRPFAREMDHGVRMEALASAPTPIQPGEQTVRAQVSVIYSIGGN